MISILSFYAASLTLTLLVLPLTNYALPETHDRGFCSAKATGLILATYFQGQLGRLGIDPWQSKLLLFLVGIAIFAWLLWLFINRRSLQTWFKENWALLFGLEGAFIIVFFLSLWLVAHNPGLGGTEKMMDFALLKAVSNASTFPPTDPWLAGMKLNYYWFGQQSAALLGRLAGLPPELTYNLMLAFIPALAFQVSCGLFLTRKMPFSQTLLGAGLITLAGNLVPIYSFLIGPGNFDFNFWRASRIIPQTITEFPFFSLLVGDLHAHFLHLPVYLLFFYWLGPFSRQKTIDTRLITRIMILNLLILVSALANPWSLPALFLLFAVYKIRGNLALPWFSLLPGLLLLPLHWEVSGYPLALDWVSRANSSPIGAFLLMWGIPLALLGTYLIATINRSQGELKKGPLFIFPLILAFHSLAAALTFSLALAFWLKSSRGDKNSWYPLAICGLLLLTGPELVFIQDIYGPPFERMNTIFKMHYAAWPLLMASTAFAVFELSEKFKYLRFQPVTILLALCLLTAFIYPGLAIDKKKKPLRTLTLNAFSPLREIHPGDMRIIEWLDKNAEPGDTCLEMTGESYSWGGRIAALSHCNTILGWQQHETLWRQTNPTIAARAREIRQFYTPGKRVEKLEFLKKYQVRWVVKGELEDFTTDNNFLEPFVPKIMRKEFQWGDYAVYKVYLEKEPNP